MEFHLADVKASGCDMVVTAGPLQSNHCRTTAIACRLLGLETHLLLKTEVIASYQYPRGVHCIYMYSVFKPWDSQSNANSAHPRQSFSKKNVLPLAGLEPMLGEGEPNYIHTKQHNPRFFKSSAALHMPHIAIPFHENLFHEMLLHGILQNFCHKCL